MKCYRENCTEPCNSFKKQYCIFRISEEQHNIMKGVREEGYCNNCRGRLVKIIYRDREMELCTRCGLIADNENIIERCLVNSRRVV